jgi:hypothetical protein
LHGLREKINSQKRGPTTLAVDQTGNILKTTRKKASFKWLARFSIIASSPTKSLLTALTETTANLNEIAPQLTAIPSVLGRIPGKADAATGRLGGSRPKAIARGSVVKG